MKKILDFVAQNKTKNIAIWMTAILTFGVLGQNCSKQSLSENGAGEQQVVDQSNSNEEDDLLSRSAQASIMNPKGFQASLSANTMPKSSIESDRQLSCSGSPGSNDEKVVAWFQKKLGICPSLGWKKGVTALLGTNSTSAALVETAIASYFDTVIFKNMYNLDRTKEAHGPNGLLANMIDLRANFSNYDGSRINDFFALFKGTDKKPFINISCKKDYYYASGTDYCLNKSDLFYYVLSLRQSFNNEGIHIYIGRPFGTISKCSVRDDSIYADDVGGGLRFPSREFRIDCKNSRYLGTHVTCLQSATGKNGSKLYSNGTDMDSKSNCDDLTGEIKSLSAKLLCIQYFEMAVVMDSAGVRQSALPNKLCNQAKVDPTGSVCFDSANSKKDTFYMTNYAGEKPRLKKRTSDTCLSNTSAVALDKAELAANISANDTINQIAADNSNTYGSGAPSTANSLGYQPAAPQGSTNPKLHRVDFQMDCDYSSTKSAYGTFTYYPEAYCSYSPSYYMNSVSADDSIGVSIEAVGSNSECTQPTSGSNKQYYTHGKGVYWNSHLYQTPPLIFDSTKQNRYCKSIFIKVPGTDEYNYDIINCPAVDCGHSTIYSR